MALMMALIVLVLIAVTTMVLMSSVQVETKVAGHDKRSAQALNLAEAGVAEAIARIRSGEIPDTSNPRLVAQIFLAGAGSVPVAGLDTVTLATAQPAGQWLEYSTAGKATGALTVRYKTDAARSTIYRYDPGTNPAIQTSSGFPIWVVECTGRSGRDVRQVVTEVTPRPIQLNLQAALNADLMVRCQGWAVVCGFDHTAATPAGTGAHPLGRSGLPGSCNVWPGLGLWELASGGVLGVRSTADITVLPPSQQAGTTGVLGQQLGFYAGPWEALGMTQSEFWNWVGPPAVTAPLVPEGVVYLGATATPQDKAGSFTFDGGAGEGFLYVDGDLTVRGGFVYRGLIYVEGDLRVQGGAWILGAVIVKGRGGDLQFSQGSGTVLFSREAITQGLRRHAQQFITLSWREAPR
jgi:hypothetical protein